MKSTSLASLVKHCDVLLRTAAIGDYDGAVNGLQVANRGTVTRIAATVDASLATVKLAIAAKADLLLVHHGLFWSPTHPWTGPKYELLRALIRGDWEFIDAASPAESAAAAGLVGAYAQWHLERGIRSLSHVSDIRGEGAR